MYYTSFNNFDEASEFAKFLAKNKERHYIKTGNGFWNVYHEQEFYPEYKNKHDEELLKVSEELKSCQKQNEVLLQQINNSKLIEINLNHQYSQLKDENEKTKSELKHTLSENKRLNKLLKAYSDKFGEAKITYIPEEIVKKTICPLCQGDGGLREGCPKCGGTGFITKKTTKVKEIIKFNDN